MTPGAEAEVSRGMERVLGYIRSVIWAMWSEHALSCSIGVSNVRLGVQDSNNPGIFTHSDHNKDTVRCIHTKHPKKCRNMEVHMMVMNYFSLFANRGTQ